MEKVKITGIMIAKDLISGCYPFVECLSINMNLLDELIIIEGGSADGTKEAIERLTQLNDKIKIVYHQLQPSKYWENIDDVFEEAMNIATGDWIIALHADEFFHPDYHHHILEKIEEAHYNGYNSIRMSYFHIWKWEHILRENWNRVRIFRNMPIKAIDGLDTFLHKDNHLSYKHIVGGPPEMVRTYVSPEMNINAVIYHFDLIFEYGSFISDRNHALFFGTDSERVEIYLKQKREYGIDDDDEDFDINEVISKIEPFDPKKIHSEIPTIFHGLVGLKLYHIREELYEKIKNCKKIDASQQCFVNDEAIERLKNFEQEKLEREFINPRVKLELKIVGIKTINNKIYSTSLQQEIDNMKSLVDEFFIVNYSFNDDLINEEIERIINSFDRTNTWFIVTHDHEFYDVKDYECIRETIERIHYSRYINIMHKSLIKTNNELIKDDKIKVRIFQNHPFPNINIKSNYKDKTFYFDSDRQPDDSFKLNNLQPAIFINSFSIYKNKSED